jgi:DNA-binding GntR family transcriptional regulator
MTKHLDEAQRTLRIAGEPAANGRCSPLSPVIETTGLADEIAFRLEAAIIAQELPPGTRLRQEELCHRFGVSRTPIREALRKLQAQRLVVMVPNKGATVRLPTRNEIEEVYDLRAELEGFAVELACQRAQASTDAELARAVAAVRRRRGAPGKAIITDSRFNIEVSGAIRSFHRIIHETAGNDRLIAVLRDLESSFPGNFCSHEMARPTESKQLHIDDHNSIREAVRNRDAVAARALMKEHLQRSKGILLRYLDLQGLWANPQS